MEPVCPICQEPSPGITPFLPGGAASCQHCNHLLSWFQKHLSDSLGVTEPMSPEMLSDPLGDSLNFADVVLESEDAFGLTIPDTDYDSLRTIGDAIRYLRKRGYEKD